MPYAGLAEFLEELLAAGELARVAAPIDDDLEIAEITARVAESGGPALLFEQGARSADGARLAGPIVTNLLGTEARACRALGAASLAALVERLSQLTRGGAAPSWLDRLRGTADGPALERFRPKTLRQAVSQQAVRLGKDIDLAALPAIRAWPGETGCSLSGRLIAPAATGDGVTSRWVRGVAIDRKHLAFAAAEAIGAECWSAGAARRPAALVLGGDPSGGLAALLDWTGLEGHTLAGLLRDQAWEVVSARSQPLSVPADAEWILEGTLSPAPAPGETRLGPREARLGADDAPLPSATLTLADPLSGYYQPAVSPATAPGTWLLEVSAITHRGKPVTPLTIVGDVRDGRVAGESAVFSAIRACLLAPLLRAAIPELVDCSLPAIGSPHGFAVLAIRKTYPGQARRAAHALWGLAPLEGAKWVVVVDDDVDAHQPAAVLSRVATNVSAERDLFVQSGPGVATDLAASLAGLGQQVGIDATVKLPAECGRQWPSRLARPGAVRDLVTRRWKEYGLPPLG